MMMRPRRATIHCTTTRDDMRVDISEIEKWHIRDFKFNSVGYHIVIQPDGEVQVGRPLNMQGAHVFGENEDNVGIALVGTDFFSQEQFESLRSFLDGLHQTYEIGPENLWCHYQFKSAIKQGKTCPNMTIQDILVWYITGRYDSISKYLLRGIS